MHIPGAPAATLPAGYSYLDCLYTVAPTTVVVPNSQCDPDWAVWRLASRTMWNPVANLDVGLEVAYTKVDTAFAGATGFPGSSAQGLANNAASGPYLVDDQSFWSATLRVQRSFWP